MKARLGFAVVVMGATATVAQVVAMRELVVTFYGNELVLGTLLANWLLCTAAGSALAGILLRNRRNPSLVFGVLQVAVAVTLPVTILAARAVHLVWGSGQGQMLGLVPMLVTPPAVIGPLCVLLGLLYTTGCKGTAAAGLREALAIGRVYVLESLGATVGGLLASFVLIRYLHAFHVAALLGGLNLLSAAALVHPPRQGMRRREIAIVAAALLALAASANRLQDLGNSLLWRGFHLLHSENTPYANVVAVAVDETISFFENGLVSFTFPDPESAENLVHLALLQHPHPQTVLLVGGGLGGAVAEVLKTPSLEHLDYVELDPRVIALGRQFLPPYATSVLADPRVTVHNVDGRRYISTARVRYDVVLIGLPEPRTTMVNRFFTREFFLQVRRILKPGGIVSFAVSSSENVIGEELARFLACLRNTLASVFPEVVVFPGTSAHFFAALPPTRLTTEAGPLLERLRERQLKTLFVREYYLPFRLWGPRVDYLNSVLLRHKDERLNTDFAPVAHYFDLVLWSRQVSPATVRVFRAIAAAGHWLAWVPGACVAVLFLLARLWHGSRPTLHRSAVAWAVFCAGFSGIALEVGCIIAFQAIYGYVYYRVALLVTAFMAGLALGGMLSNIALRRSVPVLGYFRLAVALLTLLPPVALGTMYLLAHEQSTPVLRSCGQWLVPLLLLLTGLFDGYQFPLANDLFALGKGRVERTAGIVYAVDLVGACVGAAAAAAILIPVLGLPLTVLGLTFLNLSGLVASITCLKSP